MQKLWFDPFPDRLPELSPQLGRLLAIPARLLAEQVAWKLNCQPSDAPILVAARLLKPLGNPPRKSVKFFAASEVLGQAKDWAWLAKVSNALNQHWQKGMPPRETLLRPCYRLYHDPPHGQKPESFDWTGGSSLRNLAP